MAVNDFVNITITADTVGLSRAGFGIPMILSATATFPERIRFYNSLADIADDFADTTGPVYIAARTLFSQSPRPSQIAVGRSVNKPTQVYTISVPVAPAANTNYSIIVNGKGVTQTTVTAAAKADVVVTSVANATEQFTVAGGHDMNTGDGPYRLTNSGGALPAGTAVDTDYWIIRISATIFQLASSYANALALTPVLISTDGTGTHTVQRDANDVIVSQLVNGLNNVIGKNFTAAQVAGGGDTDTLTVTGTNPGDWFSLEVNPALITSLQTHADPGVAADLTAINLENDGWYCLITLYNSNAYVLAVAAWIEAQKKIYMADVNDTNVATAVLLGSDTADDLHTFGYARTAAWYHPSPVAMLGSGIAGRCLPIDPGGETWAVKTLAGVPAATLTATWRTNITNKKANSYQSTGGTGRTFNGTTADGDYIDVQRGLDWTENDMQIGVFNAVAAVNKLAFDDEGVVSIENEVRASLARAVQRSIFRSDPAPVVTVPLVANIATTDRAARLLPDVSWSAQLAGAIHKINVNGVVSV